MIYEIAKKVNRNKNKHQFHLKMIKGTSEKIFDTYQDEVQAAFGKKMISEYGSAEAGIIAFECPKGNMHINMETVIVEEIDNEIVITNLYSMSFPIIRYKLGDYVVLDHATTCGCGMKHPIIKEVTGRVGRVIYGIKDTYPSLTLYYVFKNLAIEHHLVLNYQVVQEEKGTLNVYIENELSLEKRQLLTKEFIKYFDSDVNLSIFDKANLISTTKKKKDFISNL
jgi:phenylacetate-CoA ligase